MEVKTNITLLNLAEKRLIIFYIIRIYWIDDVCINLAISFLLFSAIHYGEILPNMTFSLSYLTNFFLYYYEYIKMNKLATNDSVSNL